MMHGPLNVKFAGSDAQGDEQSIAWKTFTRCPLKLLSCCINKNGFPWSKQI